jgi:hypothetical protein
VCVHIYKYIERERERERETERKREREREAQMHTYRSFKADDLPEVMADLLLRF